MPIDDTIAEFQQKAHTIAQRARNAVRGKALWYRGLPLLHILAQAAVVRQVESLESALVLTEAKRGYSALPFVRPACEECIWLKYLVGIDAEDAEQILGHFSREQVFEVLRAQEEFAGAEQTESLGLGGMRSRYEQSLNVYSSSRRALGERLKWNGQTVCRAAIPSTRYIAKEVDELSTYEFIYAASSRHVHFNVAELMRRVWGRDGLYEVGSVAFSSYFSSFALGWMSHFLAKTMLTIQPVLPGTVDRFLEEVGDEDLLPPGLVPIVTVDELTDPTIQEGTGLTSR